MNNPVIEDSLFWDFVSEASTQPIHGWDFSFLDGRQVSEALPWRYDEVVRGKLAAARRLLDMGTGGGEFLATLLPLPGQFAAATEAYPPNMRVAAHRLRPLGAPVVAVDESEKQLPFKSAVFDLIINRHESYDGDEVMRLLARGGTFLTQQVGGKDNLALNRFFQGDDAGLVYDDWTAENAVEELRDAGLDVIRFEEVFPKETFKDIAAVIFYLRIIPWQIPEFSVEKYLNELYQLHRLIQEQGGFETRSHRFLIEAVRR